MYTYKDTQKKGKGKSPEFDFSILQLSSLLLLSVCRDSDLGKWEEEGGSSGKEISPCKL